MKAWSVPRQVWAAAAVALALLGGRTEACSVSQFEVAEKEGLPPYSFVLFHKPGDAASEKALVVLKEMEKAWTNRANVVFDSIDVDSQQGKSLAGQWSVKTYPTTCVMAPTGWLAGMFTNTLEKAAVESAITSPGKASLRDALAKHRVAFLVLGKKGMNGFADTVKASKAAAKSVKEFMQVDAGVVEIDPTDARERNLLLNMGLENPPVSAQVFVAYGKGRAVLQPVEADDLAERLAFTVQLLGTADQCSLGMEIFGEPLLLGK